MMTKTALPSLILAVVACEGLYDVTEPKRPIQAEVSAVSIELSDTAQPADGETIVPMTVNIDEQIPRGIPVKVVVQGGTIHRAPSASPSERTYVLRDNSVAANLIVGRRDGYLWVQVRAAGETHADSLALEVAGPDSVRVALSTTAFKGDGVAGVTASIDLVRPIRDGLVSHGVVVTAELQDSGQNAVEALTQRMEYLGKPLTATFRHNVPGPYTVVVTAHGGSMPIVSIPAAVTILP